jgi:hypothetical protein
MASDRQWKKTGKALMRIALLAKSRPWLGGRLYRGHDLSHPREYSYMLFGIT